MLDDTKQLLKQLIDESDKFIGSKLYLRFVATIERDITDLNNSILAVPPTDHKAHSESLMNFGRRNELESVKSIFESARQEFKDQLLRLEESEQSKLA